MSKVSVIIPARKELYIRETVKSVMDNAAGDIEVLLVIDGEKPKYRLPRRKGLRILHNKVVKGLRYSTNKAASEATGEYLMKIDAHSTIGEGWDEILKADCPDNCIVIPRRFRLDAPTWTIKQNHEPVDAMSYVYPRLWHAYRPRLTTRPDAIRAERDKDIDIAEDMGFQGSCWFMTKTHFWDHIGGHNEELYGTFGEEPESLGLPTWLGPWGGKVLRNKKTWYAHWAKPSSHWKSDPETVGRVTDKERENSYLQCFDYWWHNRWTERVHDFQWLIEKFWPLRTWPDYWRWEMEQYNRYEMKQLLWQ